MPFSAIHTKKTLSPAALCAAAVLCAVPAFAEDEKIVSVSMAEELREVLTKTTDGSDGNDPTAVYDGYTVKIAVPTLEVPLAPGGVSESNPNGAIVPAATDFTILGDGSAATTLKTAGAGNLFGLPGTRCAFGKLTIAGSATDGDLENADARVAILELADVKVLGDTTFSDRFFAADAMAAGAIFYAESALDLIELDAADGAIAFKNVATYGKTVTKTDEETGETSTTKLTAAGGAIFLSGTLKISGANAVAFENVRAESAEADALGGALYVTAAADEPENYGVKLGAGTQVNFTQNSAVGGNAAGGAILLSGAALAGTETTLTFSGNAALGEGSALGGALALEESAVATLGEGSALAFSDNTAKTSGEFATAAGGAVHVAASTLKLANGAAFSANGAVADAAGASALGGALRLDGEDALAELSGAFSFSGNTVSVSGGVASREETEGATTAEKTYVPAAAGGALALTGGEFSLAGSAEFSANEAHASQAETLARGGAIFVDGEKTNAAFALSGASAFSENLAQVSGAGTAQGGAVFQNAGTLKFTLGAATTFRGNTAFARADGAAAAGGAIAMLGGAQTFAKDGAAGTLAFSDNAAEASADASGVSARGGAVWLGASAASLTLETAATFSGNRATATSADARGDADARTAAAGGAVFSRGTLKLAGATFSGNCVETLADGGMADGGALALAGGAFSATGALEFSGNSADARRAAAGVVSGTARGGAVYQSSGTATLADATFADNGVAGERARGGAFYAAGTTEVSGAFSATGNAAEADAEASGGAIHLSGRLTLSGDAAHALSGNRAVAAGADGNAFGGAICASGTFAQNAGTLTLSGNRAESESGNAFGGAIYARGGNVTLTDATISGNATVAANGVAAGGAVYLDVSSRAGAKLTLRGNTTISGNTANGASDGIFVGTGTADAAQGSATLIFDQAATLIRDDDGNVTGREDVETATVSDRIFAEAGTTLAIEKTGDGDLTLGEIASGSATDADGEPVSAKISLDVAGGVATLSGATAKLESLSVASGATLNVGADFRGAAATEIAGTLNVSSGATFAFTGGATTLSGTLSFDGATAEVSADSKVSGSGTFLLKDTTLNFAGPVGDDGAAASVELRAGKISLGAGTLELRGAGTLTVTDSLVVTETGTTTVSLDADAVLALVKAERTATDATLKIDGSGTLRLYEEVATTADEGGESGEGESGEATEDDAKRIEFPAFSETSKDESGKDVTTVHAGAVTIGAGVKIETGFAARSGVTLSLSPSAGNWTEGARHVLLDGAALVAPGSSAETPLVLDSLVLKGSVAIGDEQGTATYVKIKDAPAETDSRTTFAETGEGSSGATDPRQTLSVEGSLTIRENATLANVKITLSNYTTTKLAGAGTLVGDVSGSGDVSLARVEGDVSVAANRRFSFSGTPRVTGTVSNAGRLTLAENAFLTAGTLANGTGGTVTFSDGARFAGTLENAGAISVAGAARIENDPESAAPTRFAQSDTGTLTLASGASLTFAEGVEVSLAGRLVVDAGDWEAGEEFDGLRGLSAGALDGVTIEDAAGGVISDRVVWRDGAYVFLGLNGREIASTLYGDLTRENIFRMYDFMSAVNAPASASSIRPAIFGETKKTSRYMRKYLERLRRFDQSEDKAAPEAPVAEDAPGDFGRAADALMKRAWTQMNFTRSRAGTDVANPDYDMDATAFLLGSSLPVGEETELGALFGYGRSRMKHSGAGAHEIETDSYALAAFVRRAGKSWDGTLALAGAWAANDSERGANDADFNSWQLGARAEGGITFRPEAWSEIRPYAAMAFAYSRTESFGEKGGADAFALDASDAFAARGTLGISYAYLFFDALQLTLHGAWNYDVGSSVYTADAYQESTLSDVRVVSREGERSSFEYGLRLNWRVNERLSIYGGVTEATRSGYDETRANVGVSLSF
ncbi:autotransporter domain-containing protein [Candidatus Spyradosoma sp. SGI.093]|uniref:autotransporter domain-containing protein n=1 Tax=Candidatus Spyradosoma sp. SGI.093 TaxID=3420583 RepID=UPI003D003210